MSNLAILEKKKTFWGNISTHQKLRQIELSYRGIDPTADSNMAWQSSEIAITEIEVHWKWFFIGDQLENWSFGVLEMIFCFLCIHPILQAHGDPSPLFTSPEEYESRKWNHVHQCASPAVTAHGRQRERKGCMSEVGAWQCEGYSFSLGIIDETTEKKRLATKSEASEKMESQNKNFGPSFWYSF